MCKGKECGDNDQRTLHCWEDDDRCNSAGEKLTWPESFRILLSSSNMDWSVGGGVEREAVMPLICCYSLTLRCWSHIMARYWWGEGRGVQKSHNCMIDCTDYMEALLRAIQGMHFTTYFMCNMDCSPLILVRWYAGVGTGVVTGGPEIAHSLEWLKCNYMTLTSAELESHSCSWDCVVFFYRLLLPYGHQCMWGTSPHLLWSRSGY